MENKPIKTTLGLDENVESVLCYAGIWISGFLFLLLEKDNKNVRFHAMQSLVTFVALTILSFVLSGVLFIGYLVWMAGVCLWIFLMVKAYSAERFKLPVIGDFAENLLGKVPSSMGGGPQQGAPMQYPPTQQQAPQSYVPAAQPAAPAAAAAGKTAFCHQCGSKVSSSDAFCEQCGAALKGSSSPASAAVSAAAAVSGKEDLLKAVEQALSQYPQLSVIRSNQADLEIKSVLADANWGVGKKKVEYNACLLAKEAERMVVYWEMIKESGSGLDVGGGFHSGGSFTMGKTISGHVKEVAYGPDGKKVVDYDWDYGRTRGIVEGVAKSNGWSFKTVLTKSRAMR